MKKDIIFSLSSPYRDDFRVTGYRFGKGEKTCAVVGALRDNLEHTWIVDEHGNKRKLTPKGTRGRKERK